MGVAEIAEYCDVSRPNVPKMLQRYGVEPYVTLKIGKVFLRRDIERMQSKRMKNQVARAADARRRESARR